MFENLLRLAIDALPGSSYGREEKAAPHVIAKGNRKKKKKLL